MRSRPRPLTENLRARGVTVDTVAHSEFIPSTAYDVVHVHHLAAGAITMASWMGRVPFVCTTHDSLIWTGYEKALVRRMAHRYVLRQCDALVALSEREARYPARSSRTQSVTVFLEARQALNRHS
jgi:hypothetical protein